MATYQIWVDRFDNPDQARNFEEDRLAEVSDTHGEEACAEYWLWLIAEHEAALERKRHREDGK